MAKSNLILHALGTSGGPVDTKTQGFLFQLNNNFFMIDGGTGFSAIADLFKDHSLKENQVDMLSYLYRNFEVIDKNEQAINVKSSISKFTSESLYICDLSKTNFIDNFKGKNVMEKSMDLYSKIEKIFVTHPHLDHISELVLNLPVLFNSTHLNLKKRIYGSSSCIQYIKENLLNGKIWPNLCNNAPSCPKIPEISFKETDTTEQLGVIPGINIIAMNVNHGKQHIGDEILTVQSSCYIVLETENKHIHLIFGDCEWDDTNFPLLIAKTKDLINNSGYKLKTLLIECSSIDDNTVTELYGHMNPKLLCKTLGEFTETFDKNEKINLCITHIKQTVSEDDPRDVILHQLEDTLKKNKLNMYFELSVLINGLSYQL